MSKNGSTITLTGSDGKTTSVTDNNTTYSTATQSADGLMSSEDKTKLNSIATGANKTVIDSALNSTSTNPVQNKVINTALAGKSDTSHTHTKADIGLNNVTNDAQVKRNEMGAANGVATLGTDGKVPSSQLPSYVDDVLEYKGISNFPVTGESSKIYVDTNDNKTYRWSGSTYVEISASIVVGTTTGTALDGKIGNDHINNKSNPHGVTKAQVGLGNVENKSSATIRGELTKANVTNALGYTPPTTNTTYEVATTSTNGLMSATDKAKVDNISSMQTDIQAIKSHDDEQDTNIANLNNAIRINLLRPTLGTTTLNGVTCANNGDGTFTLTGTANERTLFSVAKIKDDGKTFKVIGCPKGGSNSTYLVNFTNFNDGVEEFGNSATHTLTSGYYDFYIDIRSGTVCNNLVFKPMLTTNLNATYDDFVSYEDSIATNRVISTSNRVISTRVNLLKPILQTQTVNGVTITNNGGTYTLNGTATNAIGFRLLNITKNIYGGMKLLGTPKGINSKNARVTATYYDESQQWASFSPDYGDGVILKGNYPYIHISIDIEQNETFNNTLFKPMLTTNLNATYDDFISCLGTSWTQDTINGYYTQSIICSGITSNDNPPIDVALSGNLTNMQAQQDEWSKILKVDTSTDTLKFYASEPTTVSLSVMVKGV